VFYLSLQIQQIQQTQQAIQTQQTMEIQQSMEIQQTLQTQQTQPFHLFHLNSNVLLIIKIN
jgi:hypothetical protein